MSARRVTQIIAARRTQDGAGVRLTRTLGSAPGLQCDPFLLLDEFSSDNPDDYIAGFPDHPHRGFETVTYMLDGIMRHTDHMGHVSDLKPGDVQWMRAGRGVIHSEMPMQIEGRMRGFQLWINLPARLKMTPADYREIAADTIPTATIDGARIRVIAGTLALAEGHVHGPINRDGEHALDPTYFDIQLPADAELDLPLPGERRAFCHVFEGELSIETEHVTAPSTALLGDGDHVRLRAGDAGARALLLAAKAIGEPVVQYGPFVMNTRAEIEQAIADYRNGTLTG
ncbi:MAG: pirin family protein [Wenzhouxiangellaceae bacterium]|nr:pirin family protein [Wenzhouxiangellaceae bacterium]